MGMFENPIMCELEDRYSQQDNIPKALVFNFIAPFRPFRPSVCLGFLSIMSI